MLAGPSVADFPSNTFANCVQSLGFSFLFSLELAASLAQNLAVPGATALERRGIKHIEHNSQFCCVQGTLRGRQRCDFVRTEEGSYPDRTPCRPDETLRYPQAAAVSERGRTQPLPQRRPEGRGAAANPRIDPAIHRLSALGSVRADNRRYSAGGARHSGSLPQEAPWRDRHSGNTGAGRPDPRAGASSCHQPA